MIFNHFIRIKDIRTTPTGAWVVRPKKHKDFASNPLEGVIKILEEKDLTHSVIGVEKKRMPITIYEQLKKKLPNAQFYDAEEILWRLREIKSDEEISKLEKAVKITERGIEAMLNHVREGVSDIDILRQFKLTVIEEGGDVSHVNFGIGGRGGWVFASPHDHKVERGDIIRMDVGAMYMGWRADLCRIKVFGKPSEKLTKLYKALLQAQRNGIELIKPGVKLSEVYRTITENVRKAGYADYLRGMVGHSIGLETEEEPFITSATDRVFEPNMVFCIEVPWYEPGWGGVSVEDTIVVTKDSYKELSTIDRDLVL